MNKKMTTYERPTIDVLVVRFEERILDGSIRTDSVNSGYDDENELGII